MSISWPAVLQFENDAELLLLSDQQAWQQEALHLPLGDHVRDQIIDSQGKIYQLQRLNENHIGIVESGECISLHEFLGLLKAHAAELGSCCVAKLYAPSFHDAFEMLASFTATQESEE